MFINALGAVGNYGEVYARHLELHVPRQGFNLVNTNVVSGLVYSHLQTPPFSEMQQEGPGPIQGGTLERIVSQQKLRCGITSRAGFGQLDQNTQDWTGLDADFAVRYPQPYSAQ